LIDRLHRDSDFERLRRTGRRVRSGALWCVMASDPTLPNPLVAFAIGRVHGSAVRRNRLRRQVRELLRVSSTDLVPGRYLIGLTPFEQGKLPDFATLRTSVDGLIARTREPR